MDASIRRRALEAAAKVLFRDLARRLRGALAASVDDRDASDAETFVTADARTFQPAPSNVQALVTVDAATEAYIATPFRSRILRNPPIGSSAIVELETFQCCVNYIREPPMLDACDVRLGPRPALAAMPFCPIAAPTPKVRVSFLTT